MLQGRFPRREFLISCGQVAAGALRPGALKLPRSEAFDFHFHPHYREPRPIESLLRKRDAQFDDFITEHYHDRMAASLARWRADLLRSPQEQAALRGMLAEGFRGARLSAQTRKNMRSHLGLSVEELGFPPEPVLGPDEFVREVSAFFAEFSQVLSADFQVTALTRNGSGRLGTQLRYEFVGSGPGYRREQRVGIWELEWDSDFRVLGWRAEGETRSRSLSPIFEDLTRNAFGSNSSYSAQLAHGVDYWRTVLDGACGIDIYGHNGISVGDVEGRGLDDVYICQPAGLPNRLYRNRGDGSFEDITDSAGVGLLENTACALFVDTNNDGRQDLVVVRAGGPILFLNQGRGIFKEQPDAFEFATLPQGAFTGAAAADYDRDGWLDIYFCLYVYYQGTDQYKYPAPYFDANNGPPNYLMRNNRDGTFRDVTLEARLDRNNTRYSFCCGWTDVDGNGWPDLYVVNDFGRKNLYRNNGDGTFTDIAAEAGVEDVGAGMSVSAFDYDNDGAPDLYVGDMWTAAGQRIAAQAEFQKNSPPAVRATYQKHAMGNSLLRNKGKGLFEDKTASSGTGMGRWAWSSDAWDFDHDGHLDLYVTNGMVSGPERHDLNSFFWRQVVGNSPATAKPSQPYEQGWNAVNELIRSDYSWSGYERNVFSANNGDGTFSDVSGALGLDFLEDGRAFALADLDRDGRLEVLLKNRNAPQLRLLKNTVKELPPSVCFRLRGTKSNRDAIGATVTLETSAGRQIRTLQAGSGFLSQHSKELFFGLGDARGEIQASVRWPSGLRQSFRRIPAGHRILIEEGDEKLSAEPFRSTLHSDSELPSGESLPESSETWLLAPVNAPDVPFANGVRLADLRGKCVLLYFYDEYPERRTMDTGGFELVGVRADSSNEIAPIYNLLFRSLFDRHRDMSIPAGFLINAQGEIVKIYQGEVSLDRVAADALRIPGSPEERLAKALPFPPKKSGVTFGRNYLSLGSLFFQSGYVNEAADWFRQALRANPSSAEAQYGLGSVYLKQAKTGEAQTCFEQALKLMSSYPETRLNAWNNLGLLAAREGRSEVAIEYFEQALKLNPDYVIALQNLGSAYRQQKRWDLAQQTLQRAYAIAPGDPEVNYSLGMVFAQLDQPDRAYPYLQKALQLRPNYPEAMNNLGILYLRTRRRDQAVAEFEACIRAAPAFDQSYLNLARVYAVEGEREKARAVLQVLLKEHPDHAQGQAALKELE